MASLVRHHDLATSSVFVYICVLADRVSNCGGHYYGRTQLGEVLVALSAGIGCPTELAGNDFLTHSDVQLYWKLTDVIIFCITLVE